MPDERQLPSFAVLVLPPLAPEPEDENHSFQTAVIEDEIYVSMDHPMTKDHYISFFAAVSDQGVQIVRLYPEGGAEARFRRSRVRGIYACCNRHGLFRLALPRKYPFRSLSQPVSHIRPSIPVLTS